MILTTAKNWPSIWKKLIFWKKIAVSQFSKFRPTGSPTPNIWKNWQHVRITKEGDRRHNDLNWGYQPYECKQSTLCYDNKYNIVTCGIFPRWELSWSSPCSRPPRKSQHHLPRRDDIHGIHIQLSGRPIYWLSSGISANFQFSCWAAITIFSLT